MHVYQELEKISQQSSDILFVFLDFETGGLTGCREDNTEGAAKYPILEVSARFICGSTFTDLKPAQSYVIHHTKEELTKSCSEWSRNQFKNSLFNECEQSTVSLLFAEQQIVSTIKKLGRRNIFLAGNSIEFDKAFISNQMTELNNNLSYQLLNVTSLKLLCRALYGDSIIPVKKGLHRTQDDVNESFDEMMHYIKRCFKSPTTVMLENTDQAFY